MPLQQKTGTATVRSPLVLPPSLADTATHPACLFPTARPTTNWHSPNPTGDASSTNKPLKRIMGKIPALDAFVVQLVCKLCMHSSRSALLRVVGQNHRGRGHQWLRFEWVRGWSDSRGLVYQRQPRWLLVWNMDTCRLLALVGWMRLSICEVLKWARVNGCDWTRRYG